MKKVLMVSCGGLGNGGVQSVMMNTVRGLSKSYMFDMLLFTAEKRYYDDEFMLYGGKILRVPFYEGNINLRKSFDYYIRGTKLFQAITKQIEDNGPYDIIHCNNEFESAICLEVAKQQGIPVRICHAHTIASYGNPVRTLINQHYRKQILHYSTALVGCSKEACLSFFGANSKFVVINNPFDNHKYKYNPIQKSNNILELIQVGAFSEHKNQLFTLQVLNKIIEKEPEVILNLVGFDLDGTKRTITEYISENNLQQNVVIWDSDANIPEIMKRSNAFIMPSLHEGFGIVLIEAQASGVNCYVSDNIPKSTDVGGCKFIGLGKGPDFWAKIILNDYYAGNTEHSKYDISDFSLENYCQKISNIYEGN